MLKSSNTGCADALGIPDSVIWDALGRITHSKSLTGCPKLIELLSFVVTATIGGQADELKETIIGVGVFGRPPDYDPKIDTIVRSQAWRLRKKLDEYYESEGTSDPIVIELPRGHYVPVFHRRPTHSMREVV